MRETHTEKKGNEKERERGGKRRGWFGETLGFDGQIPFCQFEGLPSTAR